MTDEKLKVVYYQPLNLWKTSKAIKMLHKIVGIANKDVKSCLVKQVFWQVHMPSSKNQNISITR